MNFSGLFTEEEETALVDLLSSLTRAGFDEPLLVGAVALRARIPSDARLQASREPDLALRVESMKAFGDFFDSLSDLFEIRPEGCTLIHRRTRVPIDLVPFGEAEDPPGWIPRTGRSSLRAAAADRRARRSPPRASGCFSNSTESACSWNSDTARCCGSRCRTRRATSTGPARRDGW